MHIQRLAVEDFTGSHDQEIHLLFSSQLPHYHYYLNQDSKETKSPVQTPESSSTFTSPFFPQRSPGHVLAVSRWHHFGLKTFSCLTGAVAETLVKDPKNQPEGPSVAAFHPPGDDGASSTHPLSFFSSSLCLTWPSPPSRSLQAHSDHFSGGCGLSAVLRFKSLFIFFVFCPARLALRSPSGLPSLIP